MSENNNILTSNEMKLCPAHKAEAASEAKNFHPALNQGESIKSIIEALLFSSERPLTTEQLKKVINNLEAKQINKVMEELKLEYEKTNRGLRIIEVAGGFVMTTAPHLSVFLKRLYKERRAERLSKPGLETLAVIAYKQPVTKFQIQSLRNVNIDGVMNSLLIKGLIRISGRKKAPGRPYVFGTTKQFLEHFGLNSLQELPKMEEFSNFAQQKNLIECLKRMKEAEGKTEKNITEIPEDTNGSKELAQEN
ncbi:MAG: SMC-Scp complex subunit ScpB [Candidatus Omnitrophota bacterium]|nr:SMC-Scp complex subunit ScpB [Candidatus Omnitrophota bacterium]